MTLQWIGNKSPKPEFKEYVPEQIVDNQVELLANNVKESFKNKSIRFVPNLTGGAFLLFKLYEANSELFDNAIISPIKVSSYEDEKQGNIKRNLNLTIDELELSLKKCGAERKTIVKIIKKYSQYKEASNKYVVICIEDMVDTGNSAVALPIMDAFLYLFHKTGVAGQENNMRTLDNVNICFFPGIFIGPLWIAGCGADAGGENGEQFRQSKSLLVKDNNEQQYSMCEYKFENGIYIPDTDLHLNPKSRDGNKRYLH